MNATEIRLPDAISAGNHASPSDGLCVMETVAYIAGEPHSDAPECACPVITRAAININDAMPDDATRTRLLGPLAFRIAGTKAPLDVMIKRAFIAADYAVRVFAPLTLDARGLHTEAAALRGLARIVDKRTAEDGRKAAAAYAAASANAANAGRTVWEKAAEMLAAMCDAS